MMLITASRSFELLTSGIVELSAFRSPSAKRFMGDIIIALGLRLVECHDDVARKPAGGSEKLPFTLIGNDCMLREVRLHKHSSVSLQIRRFKSFIFIGYDR